MQVVNAAIIVDPVSSQVIASACDQICHWHSPPAKTSAEPSCCGQQGAISCKSNVNGELNCDSLLQNGSSNYLEQRDAQVSCLSPGSWVDKCSHVSNSDSWHPLQHAAMVAIESSAERDRRLFPSLVDDKDKVLEIDCEKNSAGSPAKRQKKEVAKVS